MRKTEKSNSQCREYLNAAPLPDTPAGLFSFLYGSQTDVGRGAGPPLRGWPSLEDEKFEGIETASS